MNQIPPRVIRQLFVILITLLLGILIFLKLMPYFSGVLGAITFYALLKKWMAKLLEKNCNKTLAVSMLLVGSFILFLLPLFGIVYMMTTKIGKAINNSERFLRAVVDQFKFLETKFNYDFSSQIDVSAVTKWVSANLQNLAVGTFDVFIAISIMYFLLYYMLTNQRKLKESVESYIPISRSNLKIIISEATQKVKANAIGIPLVAFVQGVVALIGYLIFGVQDPIFWFVVTAVGSVIPFIGTALGILPVTIILLSQGMQFQALGMLIYGVLVVGASDNLIRLVILKKMADEHPLVTLLGVIIGIPLFGFIGIIFGPLMISLFMLLVKLYKKEYVETLSQKEKDLELEQFKTQMFDEIAMDFDDSKEIGTSDGLENSENTKS